MFSFLINILKVVVVRLAATGVLSWLQPWLLKVDKWCEDKLGIDLIVQEKKFWERTIEKGVQNDRDFHLALEILKGKDILEKTYNIALQWSEIAKENLVGIPDSQTKDLMNDLCSYVVSRIS